MTKKWAAKLPDGDIMVRRTDRIGMLIPYGSGPIYTADEARQLRADLKTALSEDAPLGVKLGEGEGGDTDMASAMSSLLGKLGVVDVKGLKPEPDCDCPFCQARREVGAAMSGATAEARAGKSDKVEAAQDGKPDMPAEMREWLERFLPGVSEDMRGVGVVSWMLRDVFGLEIDRPVTFRKK